jgi:tetratricopeptide (TPR) repeat protein
MGDVRGVAIVQHSLAELLSEVGQPQAALEMEERALATFERLGDVRGAAIARSNVAFMQMQWGNDERALQLYQSALRDYEQVGERRRKLHWRAS